MGDAPLDSFPVSPRDIAEAAARLRHRTLLRKHSRGQSRHAAWVVRSSVT